MYQKVKKGLKKHGISLLCSFPFLSLFITFTLIPVAMAIFLSFTRYDVLQPAQFVGLKNYFMLFFECYKNRGSFCCKMPKNFFVKSIDKLILGML